MKLVAIKIEVPFSTGFDITLLKYYKFVINDRDGKKKELLRRYGSPSRATKK